MALVLLITRVNVIFIDQGTKRMEEINEFFGFFFWNILKARVLPQFL